MLIGKARMIRELKPVASDGGFLVGSGMRTSETRTQVKVLQWNLTSLRHKGVIVNSSGFIDMERSRGLSKVIYLMTKMIEEDIY